MQAPPQAPRPSRAGRLLGAGAVLAVLVVVVVGWSLLRPVPAADEAPAVTSTTVAGAAPGQPDQGGAAARRVDFELRPAGGAPRRVRLEVAATREQRSLGLMHRTSLPAWTGMVFLFPEDADTGFWMKNTRIPLSIAFVAADGRVVSVHEMVPCTADPCRVYEPGGPYRYAVELPAGSFPEAGIGPGDQVVPLAPEQLPAAA